MDVQVGTAPTGQRYRFRCPECGNVVVNDQEMEPMCSGPGWMDEHPYEVMELLPD